jgi:hypothetical protein
MGGRSTDDSVPEPVAAAWTNKVLGSRVAMVELLRPTTPMPPLFDATEADAAALDEARVVPLPAISTRASAPSLEQIELPVPAPVEDTATEPTRSAPTTLGVAPLQPATVVRSPYVIRTSLDAGREPASGRASRTAMAPLDAQTGLPRRGIWDAMRAGLARSVRSVRWWLVHRRTARVRRL